MNDPYVMTFKIYLDVLNETFPHENLRMTIDKSAYSPEMKNARHVFYVHQSSKWAFFTYNNIKNFKTKNPLLAVLAFFTEIYKTGKYEHLEVVKNLGKRISEKYKTAWIEWIAGILVTLDMLILLYVFIFLYFF